MKTITLNNISLFIVPNSLSADEFGQLQVQLWGHTEGGEGMRASQNVEDHGIGILDENGKRIGMASPKLGFIPVSVFADKREGDKVTFMTHGWVDDIDSDDREEVMFIIEDALLQQKGWRYGRFGEFHTLLKSLVAAAKANSIGA